MHVNPVDRASDVLENRLERHEKFAAFYAGFFSLVQFGAGEEIHEARIHVRLWKIEERVEHVDTRLVELEEFIRVKLVDF